MEYCSRITLIHQRGNAHERTPTIAIAENAARCISPKTEIVCWITGVLFAYLSTLVEYVKYIHEINYILCKQVSKTRKKLITKGFEVLLRLMKLVQ